MPRSWIWNAWRSPFWVALVTGIPSFFLFNHYSLLLPRYPRRKREKIIGSVCKGSVVRRWMYRPRPTGLPTMASASSLQRYTGRTVVFGPNHNRKSMQYLPWVSGSVILYGKIIRADKRWADRWIRAIRHYSHYAWTNHSFMFQLRTFRWIYTMFLKSMNWKCYAAFTVDRCCCSCIFTRNPVSRTPAFPLVLW